MRYCALLLLAGLLILAVSESVPVAAQTKGKTKEKDEGPIDPIGRPKEFAEAKGPRYALWYEDGMWQVRTTGKPNERFKFTGGIDVKDGTITTAVIQGLEKSKSPKKADWITMKQANKGFTFVFNTGNKVDGFYFKVSKDATEITIHLMVDGDEAPNRILIGAKGRHPDKAIFSLPAAPKKE